MPLIKLASKSEMHAATNMKYRISVSTVLSLLLASSDWISISSWHTAIAASPYACVPVGRLISAEGEVQLKRQEWSGYHPIAVGAVLCLGDLLRPAKGARVTVSCADPNQNLWTVRAGVISGAASGCRPPAQPIHTITGPITPTRNSLDRSIPDIISPSSTWLLNDKPKLRWLAVPGATSYTARVSGPGVDWQTQVQKTEIVYPGQPPLKPVEEGYLLTVQADNGDLPAKATFGLLASNKATWVRTVAQRISAQNLSKEAKILALADFYIGQELIAEAIDLLEAVAAQESQTAAVYYILADLYAYVGLLRPAEQNYLQAAQLARTSNNIAGQAAAAARLTEVYMALGKQDLALQWRKIAQNRYRVLGEYVKL